MRALPPQRAACHGIKADLLIPGRGKPLKHAAVVVEEDKIIWVGLEAEIPASFGSITFTRVPVVMPGLWDCHVHFGGTSLASLGPFGDEPTLAGARTTRDVKEVLMAGFTSVREMAGNGGLIWPAIKDGTIPGPNVYSSIAAISMTAGHGDIHPVPLTAMIDACTHGYAPMAICDGVEDCIRTVRQQIRKGAKVIKVCATGGVGSELDDPEDRQFSDKELRAMVEEAARAKRIVAAHCHGKDGIIAALNAGCRTIEHATYIDDEVLDLVKEKDAILVMTRTIVVALLSLKDTISPASYAKLKVIEPIHKKAYALAVKKGVRLALGTDIGLSALNTPLSHGKNGMELIYAVQAGMTPLEAIEAATAISPDTLGPQAPRSGQLKAGYDADIIAVSDNPLNDIAVLSQPDNITHVWKAGKLYKAPM